MYVGHIKGHFLHEEVPYHYDRPQVGPVAAAAVALFSVILDDPRRACREDPKEDISIGF